MKEPWRRKADPEGHTLQWLCEGCSLYSLRLLLISANNEKGYSFNIYPLSLALICFSLYIKLYTCSQRMQRLLEYEDQKNSNLINSGCVRQTVVSLTLPSGNAFLVLYTAFSQPSAVHIKTIHEPSILPPWPFICSQTDLSLKCGPTCNLSSSPILIRMLFLEAFF